MNKELSGVDTSALQLQVDELRDKATKLGLLGHGQGSPKAAVAATAVKPGATFRGRGRGRGRGRQMFSVSHVLDRRPKQLYVAHFKPEEKEEVVEHLTVSNST